jgi:hypothetical protein
MVLSAGDRGTFLAQSVQQSAKVYRNAQQVTY